MLLLSNLRMEKMQGKMFQEIRNWLIGISSEKIFWNATKKSGQVSAGSQHLHVVLLFLVIEVFNLYKKCVALSNEIYMQNDSRIWNAAISL